MLKKSKDEMSSRDRLRLLTTGDRLLRYERYPLRDLRTGVPTTPPTGGSSVMLQKLDMACDELSHSLASS